MIIFFSSSSKINTAAHPANNKQSVTTTSTRDQWWKVKAPVTAYTDSASWTQTYWNNDNNANNNTITTNTTAILPKQKHTNNNTATNIIFEDPCLDNNVEDQQQGLWSITGTKATNSVYKQQYCSWHQVQGKRKVTIPKEVLAIASEARTAARLNKSHAVNSAIRLVDIE
jgi:hypothetical protein